MCWIALGSLAISGISALTSYNQQKRAAARSDRAIEETTAANNQLLALQGTQIDEQAAQEISERGREALVQRGRLDAVMADSNLVDNSGRLKHAISFAEGTDATSINENRKKQKLQNAAETAANNAAGSARSASVARPSLIGTGLQIGGAALDAYDKYQTRQSKTVTAKEG